MMLLNDCEIRNPKPYPPSPSNIVSLMWAIAKTFIIANTIVDLTIVAIIIVGVAVVQEVIVVAVVDVVVVVILVVAVVIVVAVDAVNVVVADDHFGPESLSLSSTSLL